MDEIKTYFPIKIVVVATNEYVIIKTPKDLPKGMAFRVLETNYLIPM